MQAVVWSILGTAAILSLAMLIPDNAHFPGAAFAVPQIFGMYYLAKALQEKAVEDHQRRGGLLASNWWAAAIGAISLVVIVVLAIGILVTFVGID